MRYTLLGDSGLRVSQLSLGTMTFGTSWGFGADEAECARQVEVYAAAGGNVLDTAVNYTGGESERIVGTLVRPDREHWVVATKFTLSRRDGDPNASGNSRRNLVNSLDQSLRAMALDHVDLLWVHVWDFMTRPDEIMRALDDQVRAGKVLYIGISDTPAWLVARMQTLAELRGWTPFAALQIKYSLADRDVERELVPMAHGLGLGITAWGPLGAGALTGKYNRPPKDGEIRRLGDGPDDRVLTIAAEVAAVAAEIDAEPSQVALAWLLNREVLPIIGARTAEQLDQTLRSVEIVLDDAHLARLDAVSAPDLGFPHDFVDLPEIRHIMYGGTRELTDVPRAHRRA